MALTESGIIAMGRVAPDFSLPDTHGREFHLYGNFHHKALLVAFICNHCPYVKHINHSFSRLFQSYQEKDVLVVLINSNDVEKYPDDHPEKMKEDAARLNYTAPYLFDETQEVARQYKAECTPDFFLFDEEKKLVYHGQYDDSRPRNQKPVTGYDLTNALDNLLAKKAIATKQKPSIGCNIKWKPTIN